jgi:hypothetical protein
MIDQPHFDHSSFAERICLGIVASGAALLTASLVVMSFFMG